MTDSYTELLNEYDALDDEIYGRLPASPDPGERCYVRQLGEEPCWAEFIGVADVDYSPAEPEVGWRGGPAVQWLFVDDHGRQLYVSPDEVER